MSDSYDVIVIGAGMAGLFAAGEAAQQGLGVCLIEELMFGGLVLNVNHMDPKPQDLPASGADCAAELMMKGSELGVTTVFGAAMSLRTEDGLAVLTEDGRHSAQAAVLATGARLRKLGVPGEAEFEHRGVSHCADCDATLFRGQDVVVVGGGDSALQEALVLARFCREVHLVHRRAAFSARKAFADQVSASGNIRTHMETTVEALHGGDALERVTLRGPEGKPLEIPCTGFFAYVGLEPNTGFVAPQLELDERGCVKVDAQLETSLDKVYAVGAVRAGYAGQISDARTDAKLAVSAIAKRLGAATRNL